MAVYQGNAGPDSFRGGTTDDSIYGRQGADTLIGGGGNDLIYGGQDNDAITVGGSGSRSLVYGGEGSDSVLSLGGQNTILGGTGINTIDPNDDGDLIDAQADGAGDLILGNGGADTILGSLIGPADFGQNAQTLTQIFGGMGADVIGFGNADDTTSAPVILVGNEGSDTITASSSASTVYGGQADDIIAAFINGNDLIFGGEGSDTINVGGGNNTIFGGTGVASIDSTSVDGSDLIKINRGGQSTDRVLVFGDFGDDTIDATIQVGGATDQLVGGQGNDLILTSFQVNDLILGNQGNDTIDTRSITNATIYGGQGNDSVISGGTNQVVSNDLIVGGEGDDTIVELSGGLTTIYGGSDSIGTDSGDNYIDISNIGRQENSPQVIRSRIFGGSGNDAVSVGSAIDAVTISGNGGLNQYGFEAGSNTSQSQSNTVTGGSGSGLDVITDFVSGTDKFYLQHEDGTKLTVNSVLGAGSESGQANLTAAANAALITASIQGANAATFSYQGSDFVAVDADANGTFSASNDILINIAGTTSLTKNDFL